MRLLLAVAGLIAATPAFASGGAWCDAEDDNATLSVHAAVTRASGAPYSLEGKVEVKGKQPFTTEFVRDDLAQFWLDGTELRFLLYKEDEKAASVEIEIRSVANDESEFGGDYRIRFFDPEAKEGEERPEVTGKVSCGAD